MKQKRAITQKVVEQYIPLQSIVFHRLNTYYACVGQLVHLSSKWKPSLSNLSQIRDVRRWVCEEPILAPIYCILSILPNFVTWSNIIGYVLSASTETLKNLDWSQNLSKLYMILFSFTVHYIYINIDEKNHN